MLKDKLTDLNDEIENCEYFKSNNPPCKHKKAEATKILHPITHVPLQESQKVLIVSQSPSRDTDSLKVDKNQEPPANFRCRIYSLIFLGKDDKKCLDIVKCNYEKLNEIFSKYFYGIHYYNCYPGKAKSGDKRPNIFCANKYLKKEIDLFKPELILTLGKLSEKYLSNIALNCKPIHSLHPSPAAAGYRKEWEFDRKWSEYKETFKQYFHNEDLLFISSLIKDT